MEAWRLKPVVADSQHYDEEWDPDTNSIEKLKHDPHLSDADPEP